METTLGSAKAGDLLAVTRFGTAFQIMKVTRTTATQVICDEYKFYKKNGLCVGFSGSYAALYARIATREDIMSGRVREAKEALTKLVVTEQNIAQVERLIRGD